jgi:hypothetical protein
MQQFFEAEMGGLALAQGKAVSFQLSTKALAGGSACPTLPPGVLQKSGAGAFAYQCL